MSSTDRIMLFDRDCAPLGDLSPSDLLSRPRMVDEVNGEHSLTIETISPIAEGTRLLWRDGMGHWREWVAYESRRSHGSSVTYCEWSLGHDLAMVAGTTRWASAQAGTHDPIAAATALETALADQTRWQAGSVTVGTTAACSLYDGSVWDYVCKVAEAFGGEVSASIAVSATGVVTRSVNLLAHTGALTPTRRFDWARDVTGITRTPPPAPYFCRIRPRGGHARTDGDGVDYSDRVGIENLSSSDLPSGWSHVSGTTYGCGDLRFKLGTDYIEDSAATAAFRVKNPDGTYTYPTMTVTYDVTQTSGGPDDAELFERAAADALNHTRPVPTYEANVLQLARAGLDYQGVALGDEIHVVDRGFEPGVPLRLEGRVLRIEQDVPMFGDGGSVDITIGALAPKLSDAMRRTADEAKAAVESIVAGGTLVYVEKLLDQINAELNTVGGWKYEVEGQGTYTYDVAVTDPPTGTGAHWCVHIGGGYIRFANSRTQAGDWNWTNVITAEGYLGLAATIARITAGYIGSVSGDNYWNLDTGEFRVVGSLTARTDYSPYSASTQYPSRRVDTYAGIIQLNDIDEFGYIAGNRYQADVYNVAGMKVVGHYKESNGTWTQIGFLQLSPPLDGSWGRSSVFSDRPIVICSTSANAKQGAGIELEGNRTRIRGYLGGNYIEVRNDSAKINIHAVELKLSSSTSTDLGNFTAGTVNAKTLTTTMWINIGGGATISGNLSVSGTKNRAVHTKGYSERLLYCHEMASPTFGDVGSATVDEDGTCVVSIDGVFAECARTDMAYQVFLQKRGRGDLWVAEKHAAYFVVEGTPHLAFDWQMFAHQTGYEADRLEDADMSNEASTMGKAVLDPLDAYDGELSYIEEIEALYEEE